MYAYTNPRVTEIMNLPPRGKGIDGVCLPPRRQAFLLARRHNQKTFSPGNPFHGLPSDLRGAPACTITCHAGVALMNRQLCGGVTHHLSARNRPFVIA